MPFALLGGRWTFPKMTRRGGIPLLVIFGKVRRPPKNEGFALWLTRNLLEIKSRDQVDDVFYQLHLSRRIPNLSYNFMPCQEVEKTEGDWFDPCETWSMNYKWYWKIAVCYLWTEGLSEKQGLLQYLRINEKCGNIPGGIFLGGNFARGMHQWGVWWVGIFLVGVFHGQMFLEPT